MLCCALLWLCTDWFTHIHQAYFTLVNVGKCIMWIHYEWLHNHNKAKHNKTVCKFLGIYCSQQGYCRSASKPGYQTNAQAHKSTTQWTIRQAVWLRRRSLSINQQYIMNPCGYNQTVLVIKVDLLWMITSMPQPEFVPTLLIFCRIYFLMCSLKGTPDNRWYWLQ